MFKLLIEEKNNNDIICMGDMKPCDIGFIVNNKFHINECIMRTASADKFEVMNLSKPGYNMCWTTGLENNNIKVRLLKPGTKITFVIK